MYSHLRIVYAYAYNGVVTKEDAMNQTTNARDMSPTVALFQRLAKAHEERGQKDSARSALRAAKKAQAIGERLAREAK